MLQNALPFFFSVLSHWFPGFLHSHPPSKSKSMGFQALKMAQPPWNPPWNPTGNPPWNPPWNPPGNPAPNLPDTRMMRPYYMGEGGLVNNVMMTTHPGMGLDGTPSRNPYPPLPVQIFNTPHMVNGTGNPTNCLSPPRTAQGNSRRKTATRPSARGTTGRGGSNNVHRRNSATSQGNSPNRRQTVCQTVKLPGKGFAQDEHLSQDHEETNSWIWDDRIGTVAPGITIQPAIPSHNPHGDTVASVVECTRRMSAPAGPSTHHVLVTMRVLPPTTFLLCPRIIFTILRRPLHEDETAATGKDGRSAELYHMESTMETKSMGMTVRICLMETMNRTRRRRVSTVILLKILVTITMFIVTRTTRTLCQTATIRSRKPWPPFVRFSLIRACRAHQRMFCVSNPGS